MWLELILVPDEVAKSWGSRGINYLGPESPYALVAEAPAAPVSLLLPLRREGCVENQYCLRCHREIETRDKSVAVYMFAQTVGVRPRQKSSSQRICFCPPCSVSLAMGPPPEGALNLAAWNMLRDLVGADPALTQAAWEALRGIEGLLPTSEAELATRPAFFEF